MRLIPKIAFNFIDQREKCVLRVYDDARPKYFLQKGDKPKGKLTAGRGHTGFVFIGDIVTQDLADKWTWQDLNEAAQELAAKIGSVVDLLTDNQYSALLAFVFNCGTGNPAKSEWNIWKVLRAQHFDQVPLELARFVNGEIDGKTVKISGLVNRRNAEIALWSKEEPGSVERELPSSITRAIVTPPTPADPVPAVKSKAIISGSIAAIAAMPVAYTQAASALGGSHLAASHPSTVAGLSLVSAAFAGLSVLFGYLHKQNSKN